jgi:hypothetical protein
MLKSVMANSWSLPTRHRFDESSFSKVTGEPQGRRQYRFSDCAEVQVDNRNFQSCCEHHDRPYLERPWRLRKWWCLVAELEIDAIEETSFSAFARRTGCGSRTRCTLRRPNRNDGGASSRWLPLAPIPGGAKLVPAPLVLATGRGIGRRRGVAGGAGQLPKARPAPPLSTSAMTRARPRHALGVFANDITATDPLVNRLRSTSGARVAIRTLRLDAVDYEDTSTPWLCEKFDPLTRSVL